MNTIKLDSSPKCCLSIVKIAVCLIVALNVYICFTLIFGKSHPFQTDTDEASKLTVIPLGDLAEEAEPPPKRSVWPEQFPYGNRIKEQIMYVPQGYAYEKTPIKRILLYDNTGDNLETPQMEQGEFIGCPVAQCMLTMDRSLGPEMDAVLFRNNYSRPSFERPPNQIWIMSHTESPPWTPWIGDDDVFNWTANYRWDSDIPNPYGYFMEYDPPLPRNGAINYAGTKTKQVAWFVSNCEDTYSNRSAYAKELAKHISVDVYGDCGTLKWPKSEESECLAMLERDYKFYLSFEDSHCLYYVTEKFYHDALGHGMLPIVMGPSRRVYEHIAPKNSFVHVDDFESPERLAEHLRKLDADDALYNEYFAWRGTGTLIRETKFFCRMCAMLHDKSHKPKYYGDFNKWWRGDGVCRDSLQELANGGGGDYFPKRPKKPSTVAVGLQSLTPRNSMYQRAHSRSTRLITAVERRGSLRDVPLAVETESDVPEKDAGEHDAVDDGLVTNSGDTNSVDSDSSMQNIPPYYLRRHIHNQYRIPRV